jgi:ribosomal protein S18 acetylase RimI-like enzyme
MGKERDEIAVKLFEIQNEGLELEATGRWSLRNYQTELLANESSLFFWQPSHWVMKNELPLEGFVLFRRLLNRVSIMQMALTHKGCGHSNRLWEDFLLSLGDCAEIELEVSVKNLRALRFYERVGFLKVGYRKGYYSNGDDAVLMTYTKM